MKETEEQEQPRAVRELERGGEVRARWGWIKAPVWTERMLEALERGVRGGKWHSLIDKVHRDTNLEAAWMEVQAKRGCGGVDGMTLHKFEQQKTEHLQRLGQKLREGTYEPKPVQRVYIPKPGSHEKRPLGIPTVIDRVAQMAIRNVIEPIFERKFSKASYGFRPGIGCKDALREVSRLLKEGHTWVVDVDIEKYFDTIEHRTLMKEVAQEIADGAVLSLIEKYLKQRVLEGMIEWSPEEGTPQGAVISPLLANIYLHPVDVAMTAAGYKLVRYADDMVILCRSREEAEGALERLWEQLAVRGLRLHPEKTKVVDMMERPGFQFLGYIFYNRFRDPRPSSKKKLKDSIRARTKRNHGQSMEEIIKRVNSVLQGWFAYFKHSSANAFEKLDPWIRLRLRAILSKRRGRSRNCGRGYDHYRWPNDYFKQLGLFNLSEARALLIQPQKCATHQLESRMREIRPSGSEGGGGR